MSSFDLNSPDLPSELSSILAKKDSNLFKKLEFAEFAALLKTELLLVAEVLTEILRKQELTLQELSQVNPDDLISLLSLVADDAPGNTVIILFLISFHAQIRLKQGNIHERVIDALLHPDLYSYRADIAHSIVLIYNRIEQEMQPLMIGMLLSLFKKCPDYFYTNDCAVIFDITLRELMREGDRCEMLELLVLVLQSIPVSYLVTI